MSAIALDTWAGTRYYAVEVVGETPKRLRVKVLCPGGVMLPGRRYVALGETALVPRHAVREPDIPGWKLEQGYYDGSVLGYGGDVDAR